jgi:hypothetical protein
MTFPPEVKFSAALRVDAGIEGILYESVLTGKECLAVFPQNFLNSSSLRRA